jgi:hypothetical protein
VARVIRANEQDSWSRRRSAGRIDRFAMGRLASGDYANPFAKHSRVDGYETEIVVLLDGSDSMGCGARLPKAATLALVIAQAAEQVGVQCEVTRFVSNQLQVIKAPRERLATGAVMGRFAVAASLTNGGTPLSHCLVVAAYRLFRRAPAKRRMVFTVTDGQCNFGSCAVRAAAEFCAESLDVEVIGLSIDSPTHGAFALEARVNSNDDVSEAGLGLLVRALEARAGVVA